MIQRVRKFDPCLCKRHRIFIIVGKRGTGKSVLQRDLLYNIANEADLAIAMTPTCESATMLGRHIPNAFIYETFDTSKLESILARQRELLKKGAQKSVVLVLDDIMYDKKALKGTVVRDLFMNGRHLHITVCISIQYLMDLTPDLRTNVDYVFSLRENISLNRQKLWKYFFGCFERYDDFARVFEACTANHSAIVMDNTIGGGVNESIYWYKAALDLPDFQIGKPVFWRYSDEYRRSEEAASSSVQPAQSNRISHVHCSE